MLRNKIVLALCLFTSTGALGQGAGSGGNQPAGPTCTAGCAGEVIGTEQCPFETVCCINLNCPREKVAFACCASAGACSYGTDANGDPTAECTE
jgi:hypothetical protein